MPDYLKDYMLSHWQDYLLYLRSFAQSKTDVSCVGDPVLTFVEYVDHKLLEV